MSVSINSWLSCHPWLIADRTHQMVGFIQIDLSRAEEVVFRTSLSRYFNFCPLDLQQCWSDRSYYGEGGQFCS